MENPATKADVLYPAHLTASFLCPKMDGTKVKEEGAPLKSINLLETGMLQSGIVKSGKENMEIYTLMGGTEKIRAFSQKIIL